MPLAQNPLSSVAPGMGGQAQALDPRLMQLAMQAVPGMGGGPSPVPPARDVSPPTDPMSAGPGGPPSFGAVPPQQGDSMIPDRVQQVVQLLMNPMKPNPEMLMILAGIGASVLFDNMGKPPMQQKPHRSNEELAAQGINTGNPAQTSVKDPAMMERGLQVNVPGGMGG